MRAEVSPCPLYPRKRTCADAKDKCPLSANSRHGVIYSITSLACARSVGGTGMPSALAASLD